MNDMMGVTLTTRKVDNTIKKCNGDYKENIWNLFNIAIIFTTLHLWCSNQDTQSSTVVSIVQERCDEISTLINDQNFNWILGVRVSVINASHEIKIMILARFNFIKINIRTISTRNRLKPRLDIFMQSILIPALIKVSY